MEFIEIMTIIVCIFIVGGVLGNYIYRKVHHLPTGECSCCKKGQSLVDQFHKDYGYGCNCKKNK